jgi:hypothetical protein
MSSATEGNGSTAAAAAAAAAKVGIVDEETGAPDKIPAAIFFEDVAAAVEEHGAEDLIQQLSELAQKYRLYVVRAPATATRRAPGARRFPPLLTGVSPCSPGRPASAGRSSTASRADTWSRRFRTSDARSTLSAPWSGRASARRSRAARRSTRISSSAMGCTCGPLFRRRRPCACGSAPTAWWSTPFRKRSSCSRRTWTPRRPT